jgi:GntR family transcriptional repressor for pyruvate dehydrogenase complex
MISDDLTLYPAGDIAMSHRKKLSQEAAESILKMIENGEVAIGDRLPKESELVDRLQMSSTAVREGIKSLIAVGLLESRWGVGTFVQSSGLGPLLQPAPSPSESPEMLFDLLEFRQWVEPNTAELAAQRRTHADLEELERCVTKLESAVARGERCPEDLGFHLALARASRNTAVIDASTLITRFYADDPEVPIEADAIEHRAIYEAVRDGDAEAARQAMRNHLERIEGRARGTLGSKQD